MALNHGDRPRRALHAILVSRILCAYSSALRSELRGSIERGRTIRQSMRLILRRHRVMHGGSGPVSLREIVRQRLAVGALPHIGLWSWVGRATGQPCIVCDQLIVRPEIEHEVYTEERSLFAHRACYVVWHDESQKSG